MKNPIRKSIFIKNPIFIMAALVVVALSIMYTPVVKNALFKEKNDVAIWNIRFENLSEPKTYGNAFVKTNPEITNTSIGDYDVGLSKPGDAVVYEFDIVNKGNIDAKITYINTPKLCSIDYKYSSCDWNGNGYDDSDDVELINSNVAYSLMYKDTKEILTVGDVLNKEDRKRVVLTLQYNPNATSSPKKTIYLNDLLRIIQYEQK